MEDIFVVWGTSGEYSDRTEWCVCWYPTEAEALDHAVKAKQRSDEIRATTLPYSDERRSSANEWDKEAGWVSDETDYSVVAVKHGRRL